MPPSVEVGSRAEELVSELLEDLRDVELERNDRIFDITDEISRIFF